jgi:flagellin
MGLRINTNMLSVNAQRNLRGTRLSQEQASARLSSGRRINKSADDAAGLAISENLQGAIRSQRQATRNAQDGISFIQVAEGGMNEVSTMIQRLRELSVQGASDTIGQAERGYLDREVQELKNEISRIARATEYNGTRLLNGMLPDNGDGVLEFQIGMRADKFLDRIAYDPSKTDVSLGKLGLEGIAVAEKQVAQEGLAKIDDALIVLNANRAMLGALQNRINSTINNNEVSIENLSAANSRIRDADVAAESAELARSGIMQQAGISVLAQANQSQAVALKLLQ